MQYTIRRIPQHLDEALRRLAAEKKTSLNEAALTVLARGLDLEVPTRRFRDLSDVAGSWQEDPEFDQARADQDRIDEAM